MRKEVYSVREVCKLYRVGPATVRKWIADAELRAININSPGKRPAWRIHREDLERFRTLRSTTPKPVRRKPRTKETVVKEFV